MGNIKSKGDEIRSFLKNNQAKTTPIKNHPISKCDEYERDLYFDMLCVIAQYENEDVENQKRFIQHIMIGCTETMTISDYLKRALVIDMDKVGEFIKQCKKNDLREIFFIDALMITCANGAPNEKQLDFLAEFGDTFEFTKKQIEIMSKLASILLNHNFKELEEFVKKYRDIDKLLHNVNCYINPIIDENIISTKDDIHFYSLKIPSEPLFNKDKLIEKRNTVIIENQYINHRITFNSIKSVMLINCYIANFENDKILEFNNIENVIFQDCIAENCGTRNGYQGGVIHANQVELVGITNSIFKNCGHKDCAGGVLMLSGSPDTNVKILESQIINTKGNIGGVICSNNRSNLYIVNSQFKDCYARLCGAICYGGGEIKTTNSEFSNCRKGDALFYGCEEYYYDNYSSFNNCIQIAEPCS